MEDELKTMEAQEEKIEKDLKAHFDETAARLKEKVNRENAELRRKVAESAKRAGNKMKEAAVKVKDSAASGIRKVARDLKETDGAPIIRLKKNDSVEILRNKEDENPLEVVSLHHEQDISLKVVAALGAVAVAAAGIAKLFKRK